MENRIPFKKYISSDKDFSQVDESPDPDDEDHESFGLLMRQKPIVSEKSDTSSLLNTILD